MPVSHVSMYLGITTISARVCSTTGGSRIANRVSSAAAVPTTEMKNASFGGTCSFSTKRSLTAPRYSEMIIAMKRRRKTSAVAPSIQRSRNVRITPAIIGAALTLGAAGQHTHLLLERDELHLGGDVRSARLELLEVVREPVSRELFIDLGARFHLALVALDLLFHARECLERRLLRDVRHRLVDALLRFGAALFREQKIFFAVCFFDVVVEAAERILEAVG